MKKLLIALLLVTAMYAPAKADSTVPDDAVSKTQQHFEISSVEGYRDTYNPGEEIAFYVAGTSPVQMDVEPKSGFHVQATMFAENQTKATAGTNGKYDDEKHAWLVTFTAPTDTAKSYQVVVALYCMTNVSPCVDAYGQAAQITKTLALQVH